MLDKQTRILYYFCYLEVLWGVWVIAGYINKVPFAESISRTFNPIWILGIVLVVCGAFGFILKYNTLWPFVIFVSTPITFLGLLFLQRIIDNPTIWGNFAVITSTGIYSAVYAGQLFGRMKTLNTFNRKKDVENK